MENMDKQEQLKSDGDTTVNQDNLQENSYEEKQTTGDIQEKVEGVETVNSETVLEAVSETVSEAEQSNQIEKEPEFKGIGGWLIVPMLDLFILVIFNGMDLFRKYLPGFFSGYYFELMSKSDIDYSPWWLPKLSLETLYGIYIVIFATILLILFFKKKRVFPKLYIIMLIFSLFFTILDSIFVFQLVNSLNELAKFNFANIIGTSISAAIWISYFIKSERVRNTFVE